MLRAERTNAILYCEAWTDTVDYYRDVLELVVSFQNDWFVEFEVAPGSFVSVADAARTSVTPGDGRGVTLSWQVADVAATRELLVAKDVDVGPIRLRFGTPVVDLYDPAGNRIELWSNVDPGGLLQPK